jgi:hypothetical protein
MAATFYKDVSEAAKSRVSEEKYNDLYNQVVNLLNALDLLDPRRRNEESAPTTATPSVPETVPASTVQAPFSFPISSEPRQTTSTDDADVWLGLVFFFFLFLSRFNLSADLS